MSTVICSHIHSVPRWQHLLCDYARGSWFELARREKSRAFYILVTQRRFTECVIFCVRRGNMRRVVGNKLSVEKERYRSELLLIIFRSMTLKKSTYLLHGAESLLRS